MRYSIINPHIHTFSSVTFRLHGNGSRHTADFNRGSISFLIVSSGIIKVMNRTTTDIPFFGNYAYANYQTDIQTDMHTMWESLEIPKFWKQLILSDMQFRGGVFLLTEQNLPKMLENKLDGWSFILKSWFLVYFPFFQPWYGVG